jgi:hypothetical protein
MSWVAVGTAAVGAVASSQSGGGGGNSGGETFAPQMPLQATFGSVNFKSPGSGNSWPSAAGIPAIAAPDSGRVTVSGLNPWVIGGVAVAGLVALVLILTKK